MDLGQNISTQLSCDVKTEVFHDLGQRAYYPNVIRIAQWEVHRNSRVIIGHVLNTMNRQICEMHGESQFFINSDWWSIT